jgi:serine/threonine-protein kinase HipA
VLKPQHATYSQLPENEDLTMRLASLANIEVPLHGLIYSEDGSLTYFIKRFDRVGHKDKLAVEDFAQLAERDRETKYRYSMEKLVSLLDHCTFPAVERVKLLSRCLFNYLVGNEDMHLKNFSLITRNGKVELAPAYDFLNTTIAYIALGKPLSEIEEIALSLKGKKRGLTRKVWVDYFAKERLQLTSRAVDSVLLQFSSMHTEWKSLIGKSFMSDDMKDLYSGVLDQRRQILGFA